MRQQCESWGHHSTFGPKQYVIQNIVSEFGRGTVYILDNEQWEEPPNLDEFIQEQSKQKQLRQIQRQQQHQQQQHAINTSTPSTFTQFQPSFTPDTIGVAIGANTGMVSTNTINDRSLRALYRLSILAVEDMNTLRTMHGAVAVVEGVEGAEEEAAGFNIESMTAIGTVSVLRTRGSSDRTAVAMEGTMDSGGGIRTAITLRVQSMDRIHRSTVMVSGAMAI